MKVLAKNHSLGGEGGAAETGVSQALSVGGAWSRSTWETGLPLEFGAELLSKSRTSGIYKIEDCKGVPHSKRTA